MKLAIMQPYFFPYLGYWQLIQAVDTFLIYDDVNYIKKGYINRNRILTSNGITFINIEISGISSFKLINEHYLKESGEKSNKVKVGKKLDMLSNSYKKSPYFDEIFPLISEILECSEMNLAYFLKNLIEKVSEYLEIETKILVSSDIKKDCSLKGQDKVLDICKRMGANQYINAIGGQALYSYDDFQKENIDLQFIKMNEIRYKQFSSEFVPNLSIIDVLMFNGKEKTKELLEEYNLISGGSEGDFKES
ncbi:MAG: WbqC family protein [Eubacteriales bacterium]